MFSSPTADHQWLRRLVGEWTYESACNLGPDKPPAVARGRERVRMLGDLWVIGESEGEMPGAPAGADGLPARMTAIMTVGFDPAKGRYVGTWVGSPMANMFIYDGRREGDRLALGCRGPSFEDPTKVINFEDIVELKGESVRTLTSRMQSPDGAWTTIMTATYARVG